jgi:hypothetical protein
MYYGETLMPHVYSPIPQLTESDLSRFWTNVEKGKSCWNWIGGLSGAGRPMFKIKGKAFVAARIIWLIHKGGDPGNLHVSRNCPGSNNVLCVNPEHLYLATPI